MRPVPDRRGGLAKNAGSHQTKAESILSTGGQNESRINAEGQTKAPENQETARPRRQAVQAAGETGIGRSGREEGKGEETQSAEGKGQDGKGQKGQAVQGGACQARTEKGQRGRGEKRRFVGCPTTAS